MYIKYQILERGLLSYYTYIEVQKTISINYLEIYYDIPSFSQFLGYVSPWRSFGIGFVANVGIGRPSPYANGRFSASL